MTYTPGPWKLGCYAGSNITLVLGSDDSIVVRSPENPDDARLIAAAPELLKAGKEVLKYASVMGRCPEKSVALINLEAAIATAEKLVRGCRYGRSPMPWERA